MFKTESYRKGIVLSSVGNFFSKSLFFLQGVVIAYYFGAQSKTDVYFYSISLLTLIAYFINSLDSSVLIPESMRLSEQVGKKESMKFLNFFFYIYLFFGVFCTVIFLISPVKFFSLLSNFNTNVLIENRELLLYSITLFTLVITTGLLSNIIASYKYFTVPIIVSTLNNFFALLFMLLFHDILNIASIYIGLLIAYSINFILLIYLMRKKLQWDFSFSMYRIEKKNIRNMFFAQAGNAMSLIAGFMPIYVLSGYSAGIIASLNFGQKTAEAPNQLTVQFSSVLGIKFNELYAKRDYNSLNNIFLTSAKFLMFVCIPFSVLMFLYNIEIISLLFHRGAFDVQSVDLSASVLQIFGFLLPLYGINTIVTRLFIAGQRMKSAFYNQLALNILIIALTILGIKCFGIIGYPLSLISVYLIAVFAYYIWLRILFPYIRYIEIFIYLIKLIILNGCIGVFIYYVKPFFPEMIILNILIGTCIYFVILIFINYVININDEVVKYTNKILKIYKSI
ncbi:MAG: lipid II flippase MurJ [Bacteroidota bacterium]